LKERKVVGPKLDNLWKHDGGKKVILQCQKFVEFGNSTRNKLYAIIRKELLLLQFAMVLFEKERKNWSDLFFYFNMLSKRRPMIDYENMKNMLQFLEVKKFPRMH